ncbi:flavodoxin family protein [Natronospora cellulosivora (SeqCode)]
MKKVLIIHSTEGNLEEISKGIEEGLENNGYQVDTISTNEKGKVHSFFPYDFVIVGSPSKGFIKGTIAADISSFLKQCKRTAGKNAIAFVTPSGIATNKSLKALMGELEKLGCFVNDFRTIKNRNDAVSFGESL